jgi:hypothetical protein
MDLRSIYETVDKLIMERKYVEAEALLQQSHAEVASQNDSNALEQLCGLFVQVYCAWQFEYIHKAEQFSLERERVSPSPYNGLQTAMVLYYVANQPRRAAEKLTSVIQLGRSRGDSSSVYSALALLGQCYLDLDLTTEVVTVLENLEGMLSHTAAVVVGDVTTFLERALARNIERQTIFRIATIAQSRCRDAAFKARLSALLATGSLL